MGQTWLYSAKSGLLLCAVPHHRLYQPSLNPSSQTAKYSSRQAKPLIRLLNYRKNQFFGTVPKPISIVIVLNMHL